MLTTDGPKVVEFNCRFGDPETQSLMPLLDVGGYPLGMTMAWIAHGGRLPTRGQAPLSTMEGMTVHRTRFAGQGPAFEQVFPASVTTVLAAAGYPDRPRTGDPITLPSALPEGVEIFHAGTARDAAGRLVTAGGRVLAVTAVAEQVHFEGKQYRADIGWREAARRSGAATGARAPRD
jgi:phosphoribosylamine---glycine ligase